MNSHLSALREIIIAEIVAVNPDFHFLVLTNPEGNLTVDYRAIWEPQREPEAHHYPYLTAKYEDESFVLFHYCRCDVKKYKSLKGVAKYVIDRLKGCCDRSREHKAKSDKEKEFAAQSVRLLSELHDTLTANGVKARLCLTADRYTFNHLCVDAKRLNTSIDITVSEDYSLKMEFAYPRLYATPETAIEILSILAKTEHQTQEESI